MNLEELIQKDLLKAMAEKDAVKISTLRLVKSEIQMFKTAPDFDHEKYEEKANSIIEDLMQKMCKKREETAELYLKNGREDLANKELAEKDIINAYLPKQATDDEVLEVVNRIITETGASSMKDMGNVMKLASAELGTRSNGKTISAIVKNCLNNK